MNYIINKEQYQAVKATWKKQESHSPVQVIAYNILRGFDAKRGFTAICSDKKLRNGLREWGAFESAARSLRYSLAKSPHSNIQEARMKAFEREYGIEWSEELAQKMLELLQNV